MKLQVSFASIAAVLVLAITTAQAFGEPEGQHGGMMRRKTHRKYFNHIDGKKMTAGSSLERKDIHQDEIVVDRSLENEEYEPVAEGRGDWSHKELAARDEKKHKQHHSKHYHYHKNHLHHKHHGHRAHHVNSTMCQETHESHHKSKPKKSHKHASKVSSSSSTSSTSSSSSSSSSGGHKGLQGRRYDGPCPNPNASDKNPNGNINFLNCNIKGNGGWKPPHVTMDQLDIMPSEVVVKGHVFKNCAKYLSHFQEVAAEHGIHATILMSFAMQESHCDQGLLGPNGEIGMMQVIPELCKGNCWDPKQNIRLGALEFSSTLKKSGGNILLAIGSYNGWHSGLTISQAKSEQYGCFAQNNLDYPMQMLNGWFRGKDGYAKEFCIYDNLKHCGGD